MLTNPLWFYPRALGEEVVNTFLQLHHNCEKSEGIHKVGLESDAAIIRKNYVTFHSPDDFFHTHITPFIVNANEKSGWNFDIGGIENFQISSYRMGHNYNWHIDGRVDTLSARTWIDCDDPDFETIQSARTTCHKELEGTVRKLTLVVQLTDAEEYKGGKLFLSIPNNIGGISSPSEMEAVGFNLKGSIIVFPSWTKHKVSEVTEGTRYTLTAWFAGPPMK